MKKKRKIKSTRYIAFEGKIQEKNFCDFLYFLYKPKEHNINLKNNKEFGGTFNSIIAQAIKESCNGREFVYAWCDEDDEVIRNKKLDKDIISRLEELWKCKIDVNISIREWQAKFNIQNKQPTLIISNPICFEGFLRKILNLSEANLNKTKEEEWSNKLKDSRKSIFNGVDDLEYYKQNLTKQIFEERRKSIPELDLLLKLYEK